MRFFLRLSALSCIISLLLIPFVVLADTVNFEDTFTEAGSSAINLVDHTPDTGTSWTKVLTRDIAGDHLVVHGVVDDLSATLSSCLANEGAGYTADATYSNADYFVEVTMTDGDTSDDYNWIGVRVEADGDGYWLRFNADTVAFAQLYEASDAGVTWGTVGSAAGAAIADGSIVKLEIIGSAIKVYDDGVEIISTTDSTYTAAGKAGVGMGDLTNNGTDDCSGQDLDNFKVTVSAAAAAAATPKKTKIITIY